jgi:hypothetical protein
VCVLEDRLSRIFAEEMKNELLTFCAAIERAKVMLTLLNETCAVKDCKETE